jgi:hypothetical protein
MSDKDFLSQFSGGNKKPDSFKEEERIPVVKEKKPFKPVYVIAPLAILAIILGVCYFLFWSPKIVMKNFVGLNKSEISSFVRQQGKNTTSIMTGTSSSISLSNLIRRSKTTPRSTSRSPWALIRTNRSASRTS